MSTNYDIRTNAAGISSYVTVSDYVPESFSDTANVRFYFSANLIDGHLIVIPAEYDKLVIKLNIKDDEDDTVEVLLSDKRTFTLNELFECICGEVADKKLYDDYDYADLDDLTLTHIIVDGNNVSCNWLGY